MKFRVTMKDPDTLYDAIEEAVTESLADVADPDEKEAIAEVRKKRARAVCDKWFSYGEYLAVDIDTDAETCVVVKERS